MSLLGTGTATNPTEASGTNDSTPSSGHRKLLISLGTSGTVMTSSSVPLLDRGEGIVSSFCDVAGNYLPLVCLQNCTGVPEEIRSMYGVSDESDRLSITKITEMARVEAIGSEGITMLPYLSPGGERTPNWPHASGVLFGLRSGHLSRPGLLYRAALESICYGLYRSYSYMRSLGLPVPDQIILVGGGAKNSLWRQIIADVFQLPVSVIYGSVGGGSYTPYIGALGAAFQAMAVVKCLPVGEVASEQACVLERQSLGSVTKEDLGVVPTPELHAAYMQAYHQHIALADVLFKSKTV